MRRELRDLGTLAFYLLEDAARRLPGEAVEFIGTQLRDRTGPRGRSLVAWYLARPSLEHVRELVDAQRSVNACCAMVELDHLELLLRAAGARR